LIEFGGWEMPVQYSSIVDEHLAVRSACGLFDISHMGEFRCSGPEAGVFLNSVLVNDVRKLQPGLGQYTLLCQEDGGVVDDLYVFLLAPNDYLLVVNASRIDADWAWMQGLLQKFPGRAQVNFRNDSDTTAAVALQGPRAVEIAARVFTQSLGGGAPVAKVADLKKNQIANYRFHGAELWVSRTGYTGEDGFEAVGAPEAIVALWDLLLEQGRPFGLIPAGLGARDTLRTEAGYPLYGHELDLTISPVEAGLSFFVGFDKPAFSGQATLVRQKQGGLTRKLVGFKVVGKNPPPRPQYEIWSAGANAQKMGVVTSGTQSPSLSLGIGMGYVGLDYAKPGTTIAISVRGRLMEAVVVKRPIFSKA
jgi:aminomethyltransferase